MRSKLLVLAVVTLVGCSEDATNPGTVAEDAAPETIGLDVTMPVDSATDSAVDSTAADSGADTSTPDTSSDARDSATVDSAVVDSAADTAVADTAVADTAVADTADAIVDSALDAPTDIATDTIGFAPAPTCDGTIATAEYGVHVAGSNQYTNSDTSQTWYMTWDDTAVYFAVTNANAAEAAVVYLDANPVTGGTDADGNTAGYTYDSTKLATLPFRANLVAYAKSGYREYRTADGSGGWSSETTTFGCFAASGTTREFSVPWSALGGRPASFGVLAYVTSSGGFVYGEIPMANPGGSVGTSAVATKYFHVGSTGPTGTASAFSDER
jgi:hypothetical protein